MYKSFGIIIVYVLPIAKALSHIWHQRRALLGKPEGLAAVLFGGSLRIKKPTRQRVKTV